MKKQPSPQQNPESQLGSGIGSLTTGREIGVRFGKALCSRGVRPRFNEALKANISSIPLIVKCFPFSINLRISTQIKKSACFWLIRVCF